MDDAALETVADIVLDAVVGQNGTVGYYDRVVEPERRSEGCSGEPQVRYFEELSVNPQTRRSATRYLAIYIYYYFKRYFCKSVREWSQVAECLRSDVSEIIAMRI